MKRGVNKKSITYSAKPIVVCFCRPKPLLLVLTLMDIIISRNLIWWAKGGYVKYKKLLISQVLTYSFSNIKTTGQKALGTTLYSIKNFLETCKEQTAKFTTLVDDLIRYILNSNINKQVPFKVRIASASLSSIMHIYYLKKNKTEIQNVTNLLIFCISRDSLTRTHPKFKNFSINHHTSFDKIGRGKGAVMS